MSVRVYVPASLSTLADALVSGGVGPQPVVGHAVTDELRAALPDADEELWEYAAMTAAARDSLGILGDQDPPRRVVVAVDATSAAPTDHPTRVEVDEVVPLRRVAAVHVDDEAAADDVAAARDAWAAAEEGDDEADAVVERCLDRDLGWYATHELPALLEQ
jgi:hypothetical protein